MTTAPPIAQLAIDIVELGIGVRPKVLLASEQDWGWTSADGAPLPEDDAPDPLVAGWLAGERELRAVFADDLEPVPADLQAPVAALLERSGARALICVRSGDELLAIIAMPPAVLRGRHLEFLDRVAERLVEALLHARMARQAGVRAALAREVELAATVQGELLPGKGPHVIGDVTVVGSWRPATRCAGDFWGVYPLGGRRVLLAIGDVTGHGVASAMVTAAAAGACDVCVRRDPEHLELGALMTALDIAVRRVGGGELVMTCFAAILDPDAREIRFVSCGHTAPYLVRTGDKGIELAALVARGNPLGGSVPPQPKVQQRSLEPGDVVVCYTDGVVEARDHAGKPYGDRRFQQLLRKLDRGKLAGKTAALAVHDLVQAGIAAHRAGNALEDDETVVIAQVLAPRVSSLELARTTGGTA
jgi:serine phosphatase RsbU (regulator of sigma subunit)